MGGKKDTGSVRAEELSCFRSRSRQHYTTELKMQRSTNVYEIKRIFPEEMTSKTGKIKVQQHGPRTATNDPRAVALQTQGRLAQSVQ